MGRGITRVIQEIVEAAVNITAARIVVNVAFEDALSTMESMVGNAGQEAVYNDYVVPAFRESKGPVKEGWTEVDIGEYMDFMGEIVGEGNDIMGMAYEEAQEILSELEELIEDALEEASEVFEE